MEYSNDFNYFLENQIVIWKTNNGRNVGFCSRLESRLFKEINSHVELDDQFIINECKKIHESARLHTEN